MKGYPRGFLWSLVVTSIGLAASGVLLIPSALELRFGWDVPWRPTGGQRLWLTALHSSAALATCAFAGALWSIHMRSGWRAKRHLPSGSATAALLAGAVITAPAVLYLGNESWLDAASAGHILFGVACVGVGTLHRALAIIERSRRATAARA
jgi:hypothetical protein